MGGGAGRLLEAGRLLPFPTFRVGAYLRWALIRGWVLNRINTVSNFQGFCTTHTWLVPLKLGGKEVEFDFF